MCPFFPVIVTYSDNMSDSSQELNAIIAQYLQAKENGETISVDQLIARYPEHAKRLTKFFEDLDRINNLADEPTESIDLLKDRASNPRNQSRSIAGRYKLLQKIGAGGMGEVWMADQVETVRRRVALKLIKAGSLCSLPKNSGLFSSLLLGRDGDDERDVASGVF
jgi:hypothetical protein